VKKGIIDLLPLFVLIFFTLEMTFIVLLILGLSYIHLLLAYIPIYASIIILILLKLRHKEED
jgi:hypothetical protein